LTGNMRPYQKVRPFAKHILLTVAAEPGLDLTVLF